MKLNKRTALLFAFAFAEEKNKRVDLDLLKHHIHAIASKNITDIPNIEERLRNGIR